MSSCGLIVELCSRSGSVEDRVHLFLLLAQVELLSSGMSAGHHNRPGDLDMNGEQTDRQTIFIFYVFYYFQFKVLILHWNISLMPEGN